MSHTCLAPDERKIRWVLPKLGHISTEFSYFTLIWTMMMMMLTHLLQSTYVLEYANEENDGDNDGDDDDHITKNRVPFFRRRPALFDYTFN